MVRATSATELNALSEMLQSSARLVRFQIEELAFDAPKKPMHSCDRGNWVNTNAALFCGSVLASAQQRRVVVSNVLDCR